MKNNKLNQERIVSLTKTIERQKELSIELSNISESGLLAEVIEAIKKNGFYEKENISGHLTSLGTYSYNQYDTIYFKLNNYSILSTLDDTNKVVNEILSKASKNLENLELDLKKLQKKLLKK